jgi:hypothetical protein
MKRGRSREKTKGNEEGMMQKTEERGRKKED